MRKLALAAVTLTAGWCSYFGQHADPRKRGERPDLVAKAVVPDLAVGAHTATLGLAFYRGEAFLGQHGSWNRSQFSGHKVTFVPFSGGRPSGPMRDFLTGFVADEADRRSTAAR